MIESKISRIAARFRVVVMTFRPDFVAPVLRLTGAMMIILPRFLQAQPTTRVVVEAGVETPVWASSRTGFLGGGPELDIGTRYVATLGATMHQEKSALDLIGAYVGAGRLPGSRFEIRSAGRRPNPWGLPGPGAGGHDRRPDRPTVATAPKS